MKNKEAMVALEKADGCFEAALAEGINDKMGDLPECEEVYQFLDVYTRRIMQSRLHIIEAMQALTQVKASEKVMKLRAYLDQTNAILSVLEPVRYRETIARNDKFLRELANDQR